MFHTAERVTGMRGRISQLSSLLARYFPMLTSIAAPNDFLDSVPRFHVSPTTFNTALPKCLLSPFVQSCLVFSLVHLSTSNSEFVNVRHSSRELSPECAKAVKYSSDQERSWDPCLRVPSTYLFVDNRRGSEKLV